MTDYLRRIRPATDSTSALGKEVEADLDESEGGIGWWNGHVGWKVSAQLGEYLISSCEGVESSLRHASLAVEEHRRVEYSLNFDRLRRVRALEGRASSRDEKIGALTGGSASEKRREDMQAVWSEQILVSLAQALDRLAAVALIVSGIKEDVLRADWVSLMAIAKKEARGGPTQGLRQGVYADLDSAGREHQHSFLATIARSESHGPEDWLPWLLKARNTGVHRAPRMRVYTMVTDRGRISGLILPLPAQPDWADTEAVVHTSRGGFESMFLQQAPQLIYEGLLASVVSLVAAVSEASRELWIERRANPELIIQHGGTWRPMDKASIVRFHGYGEAAPTVTKEIALHPSIIRRLRAAKLFGDQVDEWEAGS